MVDESCRPAKVLAVDDVELLDALKPGLVLEFVQGIQVRDFACSSAFALPLVSRLARDDFTTIRVNELALVKRYGTSKAPSTLLRFEDLQRDLAAMLHISVLAARSTGASFVAFVNCISRVEVGIL